MRTSGRTWSQEKKQMIVSAPQRKNSSTREDESLHMNHWNIHRINKPGNTVSNTHKHTLTNTNYYVQLTVTIDREKRKKVGHHHLSVTIEKLCSRKDWMTKWGSFQVKCMCVFIITSQWWEIILLKQSILLNRLSRGNLEVSHNSWHIHSKSCVNRSQMIKSEC